MKLEHRLSALLQLHLHSRLNTWLQYIVQRQLQAKTRNIQVLKFAASFIRDFTVLLMQQQTYTYFQYIFAVFPRIFNSRLYFNIKTVFPSIGIPIIKVRWLWDSLVSVVGIPILVRRHVYIEMALWGRQCDLHFSKLLKWRDKNFIFCSRVHKKIHNKRNYYWK